MTLRQNSHFIMEAVSAIVSDEIPNYATHLNELVISEIEYTSVGFYAKFEYSHIIHVISKDNFTAGSKIYADIEGMKYGAGFSLYVEKGKITLLECFSHAGEAMPRTITEFCISAL